MWILLKKRRWSNVKTFYFAKIDGYLSFINEDKEPIDWYVNSVKSRGDGPLQDKDGNRIVRGEVVAEGFSDACEKVREMTRRLLGR
jgi:hypothetical protein